MRSVSADFLRAVDGSARVTARARVCNPFVRDGSGNLTASGSGLPVLAGTLTLDSTADHRARVDGLQVAPYWPDAGQDKPDATGLFPRDLRGLPGQSVWPAPRTAAAFADMGEVSPHGNLLQLDVGMELGGGNVEYVRLGYFRIDAIRQQDAPDGPIEVDLSDLMAYVDDARPEYEETFAAGTTYGTVVLGLIDGRNGRDGVTWVTGSGDLDLDPTFAAKTLGAARTTEGDRYAFLDDLITSAGYVWYWDARGKLVVKAPPNPTVPVWDLTANGNTSRIGREITRDGVYNVIIAQGDQIDTVIPKKYVLYNDASSHAYWFTFGKVTYFFSSPLLNTDAAAEAAARTIGARMGVPYRVDADHVPNPALEPLDPVRVFLYGDVDPLGFELHVVESTTIPLAPGEASKSTMRELITA